MKSTSVTKAKNNLSALIEQVRAGNTIVITDRNRPVAKLSPIESADKTEDQRLDELERQGLITRGRGKLPKEFFTLPRPKLKAGETLLEALLDERRNGR